MAILSAGNASPRENRATISRNPAATPMSLRPVPAVRCAMKSIGSLFVFNVLVGFGAFAQDATKAPAEGALTNFSDRNANFDIFEQAVGKSAPVEIVIGQSEEKRDPQLSPDGRWILYLAWPNQRDDQLRSSGRLMRVPVSGGAPEFVAEVNGYPGSARMPRERELPSARGYPDFRCPSIPISGRPCVLAEAKGDHLVFSAFDPLQGKQGEVASMEMR